MDNKTRVRNKKTGSTGRITGKNGKWVYVLLDGWNVALPMNAEYLEEIEDEEGEHEPGQSSGDAQELSEL